MQLAGICGRTAAVAAGSEDTTQASDPSVAGRRVPGLRREEVALLAGVSVDYYARLERGYLHGVSEQVLGALARALQLDEAERAHLFDLGRARMLWSTSNPGSARPKCTSATTSSTPSTGSYPPGVTLDPAARRR
jgi:hypothetical protein